MHSHPALPPLPIDEALQELCAALRACNGVVLHAPPGAGKTTRVPLMLLDEPWLEGRRIVMLEPRRVAARSAARRTAMLLDEHVGETVGYRTRGETRVSTRTRIEVATEGVLTRMIQSDPALEGIGLVIFDEFHERSLHADLGLALSLQAQALLRQDLRILVMSATLDAAAVAALMNDAPIVSSAGRAWPVETRYVPRTTDAFIPDLAAGAVRTALSDTAGGVLVFLPGVGEIRRVDALLRERGLPAGAVLHTLHGTLDRAAQDAAIAPASAGQRKIVLATAVAETSLTIEGIGTVVDSGWARVPRFSPRTGMTHLATVRVSRASADQRRGRAGRLGPGVCYRLWPEHMDAMLPAHPTPEIRKADLVPLALDLAAWGAADAGALRWLDAPPAGADRDAVHRARTEAARWRRVAAIPHDASADVEMCGLALAFAYPDRIAQRRPGPAARFLLRNGAGAYFADAQAPGDSQYIVAADLDGARPESRIYLAAPLDAADLEIAFADQITCEEDIRWASGADVVRATRRERLGAITLREGAVRDPAPDAVARALLEAVRAIGVANLPWPDEARQLRQRVAFLRTVDPTWPDLGDAALDAGLERWLLPHLAGAPRGGLAALPWPAIVIALLPWERRAALDDLAPTHLAVPSGSSIRIDYSDPDAPVLAVRLQEMFGLADTPRIAASAVPLTLHLLSPAQRPVQVTRDLAGFWRGSYFEVRKDMRGRYPRHPWPDDPLQAPPTRRAKPRGK